MSVRSAPSPSTERVPVGPGPLRPRPPAGGRRRRRLLVPAGLAMVALFSVIGFVVARPFGHLTAPSAGTRPESGTAAVAVGIYPHGALARPASGPIVAPLARPAPPVVHYRFADGFSGPAGAGPNYGMARRYWLSDPCWTNGCGYPPAPTRYALADAQLDGHGHLVLTARDGATGSCGPIACRYTSARLTMLDWPAPADGRPTFSEEYGTFSARIKIPVATDVFPAFFLVGSDLSAAGWPPAGEIDVLDGVGASDVGEQQAQFGTDSYVVPFGGGFVLPPGESLSGWHVYSVTWSRSGIVWSVDGRQTLSMPASRAGPDWSACFEHPFSMVLELEVGSAMSPALAARELPAHMLVDWVHVSA